MEEMTNMTKQARHLTPGETFSRWQRQYTVIANERGTGGRGRSVLAAAESGERVILPMRATGQVEIVG